MPVNMKLPRIIDAYIRASNQHDLASILACFSNNAVVHDEGETLHGKQAIDPWIRKTIEKYKFQFKPISFREERAKVIVAVEVSGTFPGSPVTLDYHFTIQKGEILSLKIE